MEREVKKVVPSNLGWLELKLSQTEMNYLWGLVVDEKKETFRNHLAGNLEESNVLVDKDDWFFENTLLPLCNAYADAFKDMGYKCGITHKHPYCLSAFWVNYQKKHEFNPIHTHFGIYSFVIWMRIPTRHDEQNELPMSKGTNYQVASDFMFTYTNMFGEIDGYTYEMNPELEGTLLFFPAKLNHQVYPFYNCDDTRITISGNISLNSKVVL